MSVIDLSTRPTPSQVEENTNWLAKADFKIVRPLVPHDRFAIEPRSDAVIELGMVLVEVRGLHE